MNAGIPGTGLSFRSRVGSDGASTSPESSAAIGTRSASIGVEEDGSLVFTDTNGAPLSEAWVKLAKKQHKAAIQGLIASACEKVNKQVEALGDLHLYSPAPTERTEFVPTRLSQPQPTAPIPRVPGFFARFFKSKVAAIESRNKNDAATFNADLAKWKAALAEHEANEAKRQHFLEVEILENVAAMERHLEATLQEIVWPRETDVSLDIRMGGAVVFLDVDLPELEDMPRQIASVPSRGLRLSVKEMSPTQAQRLYMRHVHAVGFRILGETIAALPTVRDVILSAYSQRPSKATGHVIDEYLYSVHVTREGWSGLNFRNLESIDVVEAFTRFDFRRQMTKTGVFKPIDPIALEGLTKENV